DAGRGSVAAWLMTLCRSRAIDRLRARQRRAAAETPLSDETAAAAVAPGAGPEERAATSLRRRRIEAALAPLGGDPRPRHEPAYCEGLSHAEIASRLKEPLGTIKTRIGQGMMTLRGALAPPFEA